ncbi:MAG: sulfite exporter TauE/SafE family protein [Planctomycetota bacterium]
MDWFTSLPPEGTPLWWYITALAGAVVVIGIAKSGFGGGIGILAVPLVASALPVSRTVGVMLPVLIAADVVAVWQHRRSTDWGALRPALIGAAVGVVLGAGVILLFRDRGVLEVALRLVVGGVCLVFVGVQVYRMIGGRVPRLPGTPVAGGIAGGIAGGVSTLAHAAGPVMSIYWLERRFSKAALVGTLVVFFFVVNWVKVPFYLGLGLINGATLMESALVIPLIPLGAALGFWMHRRMPERPFMAVMYSGAAAAAGWMIWTALA